MDTEQIYGLVNDVAQQTMGAEALTAIDTSTLVALGDSILSSSTNTEAFLDTLVQRIGRTIIRYRKYESMYKILALSDMEYGQILQKIRTKMPVAVEDDTYNLIDGQSLDMYIVSKPEAVQKLFVKRTPVAFFKTFQRKPLKEAFLSAEAMGAFLASVTGEVRNYIELTDENLGRLTVANYIVNASTQQVVNLVTEYNATTGSTITTGPSALYNEAFCRFAIGRINVISSKMRGMSQLYNDGSIPTHSPYNMQNYLVSTEFQSALQTQVQYAAFHDGYVSKVANVDVPYWQNAQSPFDIKLTVDDEDVTISNVVAMIADKEAMGTYRKEEEALTTPVNARGRYYNTWWHLDNLYLNDLSENGVVFTLN